MSSGAPESSTADSPSLRDPRTYLHGAPEQVVRGRNTSKATLKFYRIDGRRVALKDYGERPFAVRNTVGRFFARREATAYLAASGIEGLPAFYGRAGPFAIALEWLDARPLAGLDRAAVPPDLPARLKRIVTALHARGIAIGDLHHRDVLVSASGSVHLVDLAAAWSFGAAPGRLRRALFARLVDLDRVALARIEARCLGRDEREVVLAAAGAAAARRHALGRRVKALWDAIRGRKRRTRVERP